MFLCASNEHSAVKNLVRVSKWLKGTWKVYGKPYRFESSLCRLNRKRPG